MALLAATKDMLNAIFAGAGSILNVGLALGDKLDALDTASHTHANKSTLDLISAAFTTALKSSYDAAVVDSHTHSNKTVLDATQESFTTALKSDYDTIAADGLVGNGISGTFVTADVIPLTVTVVDGQITSIV